MGEACGELVAAFLLTLAHYLLENSVHVSHKYDLCYDLQLSATCLNSVNIANVLVLKDRISFL